MTNPWQRLRGLVPEDAMQVGEVLSVGSDGTSVVALIGGGSITASGDGYAVSARVFVKGSAIVSAAPALTPVDIEV